MSEGLIITVYLLSINELRKMRILNVDDFIHTSLAHSVVYTVAINVTS